MVWDTPVGQLMSAALIDSDLLITCSPWLSWNSVPANQDTGFIKQVFFITLEPFFFFLHDSDKRKRDKFSPSACPQLQTLLIIKILTARIFTKEYWKWNQSNVRITTVSHSPYLETKLVEHLWKMAADTSVMASIPYLHLMNGTDLPVVGLERKQ